jgi:hypothetical protein
MKKAEMSETCNMTGRNKKCTRNVAWKLHDRPLWRPIDRQEGSKKMGLRGTVYEVLEWLIM